MEATTAVVTTGMGQQMAETGEERVAEIRSLADPREVDAVVEQAVERRFGEGTPDPGKSGDPGVELPGGIADVQLLHEVFEGAAVILGVEAGSADVEEDQALDALAALVYLHFTAAYRAAAIIEDLKREPCTGCHGDLLLLTA